MSKESLYTLIAGIAMVVMALLVLDLLAKDSVLYQRESECVQRLIDAGVERSEIVTKNGYCFVKQ